jgi:hypothetical protein
MENKDMEYKVDPRKAFATILDLYKIDKEIFDGIDDTTIECVYENRIGKTSIYTAQAKERGYCFVFSLNIKKKLRVVKTLNDLQPQIIVKLLTEDFPSLLK